MLAVAETEYFATKIEGNRTLRSRLRREVKTPVSLIAEDIEFINRRLRKSQYFYIDIKREGIILYDAGKFELAEAVELSPKEREKLAEEDFESWLSSAKGFFKVYQFCLLEGELNLAAFNLHQTTEFLYNTFLLVFTRYKPNNHDLEKLSQRVASTPSTLN